MSSPRYGYDPLKGTEQFYDCELPTQTTAPITRWLRDVAKINFHDFRLPDGHVIRAITPETALECYPGSEILPDA